MSTIDYARMQREHPKQKAALTRAMNAWRKSGKEDNSAVVKACRAAVQAWNEIGCWPDDWSHWQRALNDTEHWNAATDLRDL
jgi:hypothetical protein